MGLRSSNLAARYYGEKQTCPWLWGIARCSAANRMCLPSFGLRKYTTSFSGRPDPSGIKLPGSGGATGGHGRGSVSALLVLALREMGLRQRFGPTKCAWSPRPLSMRDYGRSVQIGVGQRSQNPTSWSCLALSRERLKGAPCCGRGGSDLTAVFSRTSCGHPLPAGQGCGRPVYIGPEIG